MKCAYSAWKIHAIVTRIHWVDHLDIYIKKYFYHPISPQIEALILDCTSPCTSQLICGSDRSVFVPYKCDVIDVQNYYQYPMNCLVLIGVKTKKKATTEDNFVIQFVSENMCSVPKTSSGHVEQSKSVGWLPRIFSVSMNVVGILTNGSNPLASSHAVMPRL